MTVDYTRGVVGREPVAKTICEQMFANHPDWSDEQVAARINWSYGLEPVISVAEVAHWRQEVSA